MTLGMEVGLGPGHIVLDEDPALPPQKGGGGTAAPNFRLMYCGQTAGRIKTPLGTMIGLVPGQIVVLRQITLTTRYLWPLPLTQSHR